MHHANIPDRKSYNFLSDKKIQDYAEKAVSLEVLFSVSGVIFEVFCIKTQQTGINGFYNDSDNIEAYLKGYTNFISFAAINTDNKKIYAIYEVYSHKNGGPYLNKSIDVDCNHQRIGIGTAFMKAMVLNGIDARRSSHFTRAGAQFFNSFDINIRKTMKNHE